MDEARIRTWWWHRQGLDGSLDGKSPAAVLERAGWARSLAGVGPYLTLFARGGTSREATDAAVAKLEIHELPSARGCTYVVPASDFALALAVGQTFNGGEMNTARKLGVTDKEVDKLCDAVRKALDQGPLDPDGLRESTGGAVRSLGAEGQKKGLSSTLPLALGTLQSRGDIRRVPINGRLDQQRYRYTLWKPNPLVKFKLSAEEALTELARRYFTWIGPATAAEFQWFSGLGAKAVKAAIEPLQLVPPAPGDARLMFPKDREALEAWKAPKQAQYVLVSSLDSISALRRDSASLVEPQHLKHSAFAEKGALADLPNHAILDRGRLVGLWEYDTATQSIAWASFGAGDKALAAAVARTEEYVRAQLGDARSFSLDSPKSRAPKIEALRKWAG
jgi:winged helix DNA-binding protein